MRTLYQIISWIAILGTILPSVLFLFGMIELALTKQIMLVATVVWFVATPLWMGRSRAPASRQQAGA